MREQEIASQRQGLVLGREVVVLEECRSTQEEAMARAAKGAPHGTLVVARRQTHGRGRRGRSWLSPEGGLYFSLLLRPSSLDPEHLPRLTPLAGAGVLEGIASLGVPAFIKWPNDVLIPARTAGPLGAFRKVAGVLVELHTTAHRVEAAILGAGVNVRPPPGGFSKEIRDLAGALSDAGVTAPPEEVLLALLTTLQVWLERPEDDARFSTCLEHLRKSSATLGRPVRIEKDAKVVSGIAEDFDADGALLVRSEDGTLHRVVAGDVWPA